MSDELPVSNDGGFEMTYPCYFLMIGKKMATLNSEGDECFILFTEKTIAEAFYRHKYPEKARIRIQTWKMLNRTALLDRLKDMERDGPPQGVAHVAIDPTQGRVGRVTIREFIEDLEKKTD